MAHPSLPSLPVKFLEEHSMAYLLDKSLPQEQS
jgi:hypothetical protein